MHSEQPAWWREKEMIQRYEHELHSYEDHLEKDRQAARDANKRRRAQLDKNSPSAEFKSYFASRLEHELQNIETDHREKVDLVKKAQETQVARFRLDYEEALKAKIMPLPTPSESSPSSNGLVSLAAQRSSTNTSPKHQPSISIYPVTAPDSMPRFAKPFTYDIRWEVIGGKKRLMLRYQAKTKKRKSPEPEPAPDSKRPRIDTSANPLQTPSETPSVVEGSEEPPKTITFDEVYQKGHAMHKDTIVERPKGSGEWYILKCVPCGFHFTERPVLGAAKHLNGKTHGSKDRNQNMAVKSLGYRVIDCNEDLVAMNNSVAAKAYANGYRPNYPKTDTKKQPKTETDKSPSSLPKRSRSSKTIAHPKEFHLYNCCLKPDKLTYPVLILGWDDLTQAGLADLASTGLLNKESNPPPCYMYESNKIVGWSPGYRDGESKVKSRQFPAMFFDDRRNVSWIQATALRKFPLYSKKAPKKADAHWFHMARHWVAKKEGFDSWKEREVQRAREGIDKTTVGLKTPSVSPPSPVDENKWRGKQTANDHPLPSGHKDIVAEFNNDLYTDPNTVSRGSNTADKTVLENGVQLSDDNYTESNIDSSLEEEVEVMEDYDVLSESGRPWAFYQFRKKEGAKPSPSKTLTAKELDEVNQKLSAEERSSEDDVDPTTNSNASPGAYHSIDSPVLHEIQHSEESQSGRADSSEPCIEVGRDNSPPRSTTPPNRAEHVLETVGDSSTEFIGNQDDSAVSDQNSGLPDATKDDGRRSPSATLPPTLDSTPMPAMVNMANSAPITAGISVSSSHATLSMAVGSDVTPLSPVSESTAVMPPTAAATASFEPPGPADFELSFYSNRLISWSKDDETAACLKMYYGADGKTMDIKGVAEGEIDPLIIASYSRANRADGNSVIALVRKDNSTTITLLFDRSKGSTLKAGKIQARDFLRWLKSVNKDVVFRG